MAPTQSRERSDRADHTSGGGRRWAHVVALLAASIVGGAAIIAALIQAGILWGPQNPAGEIESPAAGSRIPREFTVTGTFSNIPDEEHLWLAVQVGNVLYPKEPEIDTSASHFSEQIVEGGNPPGGRFSLVLLRVDRDGQAGVERWLSALRAGEEPPGLTNVTGARVLDAVANLRLED